MSESAPSNRVVGPYTLLEKLGHNNVSAVFRARHIYTENVVALRIISQAEDDADVKRFLAEIEHAARIRHRSLVSILDYGAEGENVFIAMPLLRGRSLQQRLDYLYDKHGVDRRDPLPPEVLPSLGEVADLLERIGDGLDHCHEHDYIHHHLQPRNILFDEEGAAYLADTGLAKLFKVIFSLRATHAVNTHPFSPPEQWNGEKLVPASDQYAMAGIVYLLVTGKSAFHAATIFGMMDRHLNDFPMPPHLIRPGVPGGMTNVLIKAMAKPPEMRYKSMTDFVLDFRQAIFGHEGDASTFFTFPLSDTAE